MKIHVIGKYMTPTPRTIGADQKIETALDLMNDLRIRHLPVLHGGKLVGIVSDRDIRLVEALEGIDPSLIVVEDVMIPSPYTVAIDEPLSQVASQMAARKYGSVVIMEKEKVVGIFTAIDALKILADFLGKE